MEKDGTIVACEDCAHLVREHIGFQMGTVRREDGRFVLLDRDLLSMCGKRRRRPGERKAPVYKSPAVKVCEEIIKKMKKQLPRECPQKKTVCRFFNDAFQACAATERAFEMETMPCQMKGDQP